MRALHPGSSLLIAALICVTACAGDPPPAPTTPEASLVHEGPSDSPSAPSAVTPPRARAGNGETGWAGEEKSADHASDYGPAHDPPAYGAPSSNDKPPETRTMDVIRARVVANRKAARKCYEDARKDAKDLQGDVVIHFVLDPEGKVKLAELNRERSTLNAPAVVDCVVGVIKGIDFPRSSRAMETSANYPFNFTP